MFGYNDRVSTDAEVYELFDHEHPNRSQVYKYWSHKIYHDKVDLTKRRKFSSFYLKQPFSCYKIDPILNIKYY